MTEYISKVLESKEVIGTLALYTREHIARTHRFTTKTHWRTGALFADGPERRHVALVRAYPHDRCLELAVRGPAPQNFFALLKDGIEVTLARFPGLPVRCMIPCPGHAGQPCRHEFDHDQLIKRLNKKPTIECPEAIADVSVAERIAVSCAAGEPHKQQSRQHTEDASKLRGAALFCFHV